MIEKIAQHLIHRFAVGQTNISGDDWGTIFANAVGGEHWGKPLGLTDIVCGECAWTAKTVQNKNPHKVERIRLIMGRNSPAFSYDIDAPLDDIQKTGDAVLGIWNERVDASLQEHAELREIVLIRNMTTLQFSMFEMDVTRYAPGNFKWRKNARKNLEGIDATTESHQFTWQPHGAQFTILIPVPGSATHFSIRRPPTIPFDRVMKWTGFKPDWVTIHNGNANKSD